MPRLFCQEHGQEQEARCIADQENYRRFGEAVLIVVGPVKSPSHRCRACNVRLRRGQRGYLVTAFPRHSAEDFGRYDYALEGEYLVLEHAEARLYGAGPPGGSPPPVQRGRPDRGEQAPEVGEPLQIGIH